MPAVFTTLMKVLGSTLMSMLTALITEKFLKRLLIQALESLVKKTATEADDKLLQDMKAEWDPPKGGSEK